MKRRSMFVLAVAAALFALVPSSAVATEPNNESATYRLVMFAPGGNRGVAPNGDLVRVTCRSGRNVCGTFSVHPKSVEASGEFVHEDAAGNVLGGGTWTATDLLSFQPYGCGVVLGTPLPPNFCGGQLKLRVTLKTPIGQLKGILTVFCIVGPNPPNSAEEGVTLDIPGVINFNHSDGGGNIYIKTSPAVS